MRCFAMLFLMAGTIAQQSDSTLMSCSKSQNQICYEELTGCFQAWKPGSENSTVQLSEFVEVALACGFSSLALEFRDTEPNNVMRKHLDMLLLNHALAMGQLEAAAGLVGDIPNPDEGRAKVAATYAMRGEFKRSAEVIRQIVSPGSRGAEWFRIAALATDTDRNLSDSAMGQGAASLKALDPLAEIQGTEALALCVVAQIKRSPNKSPLQNVNQLCAQRGDDLRESVCEELLKLFSTSADSVHYEQLIDELLRQDVEPTAVSSSPYSCLNDTVRRILDDLGPSLVRAGSDVEKTLPAILVQFQLDRSFTDRVSDHSDTELAQDLAAATAAADADKAFSDKIYFGAIDELAQRSKFSSAFELVRHLHRREDALIRISSYALMNGKSDVAAEAVLQWERSISAFNENVFEHPVYQELIPILVKLEKKPILDRMVSASQSSEQILRDAQQASDKGGLNIVDASNKLNAVISMADVFAALDRCETAEQLIVSVSDRLETIQLGTLQATLASRIAVLAVESLGIETATAMLKPDSPPAVRLALINRICYEYGRREMKSSADAFLTLVASPDEAVSGRLSLVKGLMKSMVCAK